MHVRRIFLLLLLAGVTGCGAGFPLAPTSWGGGAAASGPAAASPQNSFSNTTAGNTTSWWLKPVSWLKPNKAANNEPQLDPGTISPDDPLSLRNTPNNLGPDIHVKAGQLYEANNNLERAAFHYGLALKIAPDDPTVLIPYARLLDRQGKFDEAIEMYSAAGHQQPENASIRNDLGLCLARQGQVDVALRELDYAVRLRPQETLYRNNIAKVLVEVGRPDDALNHLLAVHPPAVAHYNVGFLLYEKQQPQLAANHFQRALELDRSFVKAARMLQLLAPAAPAVASRPGQPHLLPPAR